MPNLDQTGPRGQGAGTGRRAGKCFQGSDSENVNEQNLGQGRGAGLGRRGGRCRGAGRGLGRGLGRN
ncbi:MAG: DUF5320 domain-containing protein [Bacteroidota bacterium]|jgi:hypothetical protein|nr:DUF5320 domain-containing protein [Bacteroidota bacterium]NLP20059.1 DUF5320 domain-containing protein [Bacteroidales bacterium]OQC46880.1 MAG: hypothetical protein BWX59_00006 [Bacteroidetes bacterium ADurb.Bin028]HNY44764.1 DUF5320 domain-containing protein [Bacteroidales bacterium]HOD87895.1 DUF5320 domain-containing protein [Bacteroidales bacterium]